MSQGIDLRILLLLACLSGLMLPGRIQNDRTNNGFITEKSIRQKNHLLEIQDDINKRHHFSESERFYVLTCVTDKNSLVSSWASVTYLIAAEARLAKAEGLLPSLEVNLKRITSTWQELDFQVYLNTLKFNLNRAIHFDNSKRLVLNREPLGRLTMFDKKFIKKSLACQSEYDQVQSGFVIVRKFGLDRTSTQWLMTRVNTSINRSHPTARKIWEMVKRVVIYRNPSKPIQPQRVTPN